VAKVALYHDVWFCGQSIFTDAMYKYVHRYLLIFQSYWASDVVSILRLWKRRHRHTFWDTACTEKHAVIYRIFGCFLNWTVDPPHFPAQFDVRCHRQRPFRRGERMQTFHSGNQWQRPHCATIDGRTGWRRCDAMSREIRSDASCGDQRHHAHTPAAHSALQNNCFMRRHFIR